MFRHLSRNRRSASVARILSRACMFETLEKRQLMSGALRVIDEEFIYDAPQQSLRFTFNDDVSSTFTNADVTSLVNLSANTSISSGSLSVSFPQSNVVSITFPTTYLADGDWRMALGADGANQVFEFSFFRGDANADSKVDIADLYIVASNYLTSGKTYSQGDFDYDGDVDNADYSLVATKWQATTFDVSIDSDNGDTSGFPDSRIEENINKPGKIVAVSNGDSDNDGIVDFADGYSLDPGNSDTYDSYNLQFAPIKITLPSGVTLSNPKLRVFYDYSDPRAVTGDMTDGYLLPSGSLRVWREQAAVRSYEAVVGSLSGTDYTGTDLTTLGLATAGASVTWYVEAVRASASMADQAIRIEFYPNGADPDHKYVDTVRLTAMNPGAAYFGDAASDRPGGTAFGADGGDPASLNYNGPVRYADGTVTFSSTDLDPAEAGILSGQTRTWSSIPSHGANGTNGNGWTVSQWPSLVQGTNSILVSSGGRSSQWFDYSGSAYTARLFSLDLLAATGGGGFVLTDTLGTQSYFHGFAGVPAKQRGQIEKFVDSYGNETNFEYDGNGVLETVKRMPNASDSNPSVPLERLEYSYSNGLLASVMMYRRDDQNDPLTQLPVRRVNYTYYGVGDDYGNPGDLNTVTVQQPVDPEAGTLTWFDVEHKLYRYDGESRLILVLEGASYERAAANLTLSSASTSALGAYADYVFDYYATDDSDPLLRNRVKSQKVQGAGTFAYDYVEDSGTTGINSWLSKVIEYLPDSTLSDNTDNDQRVVYSNFAYETMASIFMPDGVTDEANGWVSAYRYDDNGRILQEAMPSSVTDVDSTQSSLFTLSSNSGLIYTSSYLSNGYLEEVGRAHGDSTPVIQQSYTYWPRPSATGGSPTSMAFLIESETSYRDDAGADPIVSAFEYSMYSGTDGIASITKDLPVVDTSQNGDGSTGITEFTQFDRYGRVQVFADGVGRMREFQYADSTGAITEDVRDWQNAGGLEITTLFVSDLLGRTIESIDPNGNSTRTEYFDDAVVKRVVTLPPETDGDDPPANIVINDRANGVLDVFAVARDGSGDPTSTISERTQTFFNTQQQIEYVDRYPETTSLSYNTSTGAVTGTESYYRTSYGYDARGRQDRVAQARNFSSTNPTITRTVFDGLDRLIATWIGTDDSSWSPSSPGSNMTLISENEYDGGSVIGGDVGDGNSTEVVSHPDPGNSSADRITAMRYDWRDRMVLKHEGVSSSTSVNSPLTFYTYDNMDRSIAARVYDGDAVGIDTLTLSSVDSTLASSRRAYSETLFDDRGRVYRTLQHSIDQSTGTDVGSLATDQWFDDRNNLIKVRNPGGMVTKFSYDTASRLKVQYTTDGGNDSDLADAGSLTDDIVLEQVEYEYDDNGNILLTTVRQRHHDETGTGDLVALDARVTFVANWYDDADRLVTTINYGNNGNDSLVNSSTGSTIDVTAAPQSRVTANGWDEFLRTDYEYVSGGYSGVYGSVISVTDPKGIITETRNDSLGRKVQVWEARSGTSLAPTPGVDTNRGTLYAYNGFDQVVSVTSRTYLGSGGRNYTTNYTYGISKGGNNKINHSGLLSEISYSTSTGGNGSITDHELYTGYNALGEVTNKTQRNTSTHVYSYSPLGQLKSDEWTNTSIFTGKISTWASELSYAYDTLGRGVVFTTLDGTDPRNEVVRSYDGLGNLVSEETTIYDIAPFGSPTTVVGMVEYEFDTDFGANYSRLQKTVYPNGRVLWHNYGTLSDLNDQISRIESIADGTSSTVGDVLESYTYLGLGRVVKRTHDSATFVGGYPLDQSYVNSDTYTVDGNTDKTDYSTAYDDAGIDDPYNGLDRFGRVVEQFWGGGGSTKGATRLFAYDADGNVLYSVNPKSGSSNADEKWRSEVYHPDGVDAIDAYDNLGRMTDWQRGVIGASNGRLDQISGSAANPNQLYTSDQWSDDSDGNFTRVSSPTSMAFQGQVPLTSFPEPTPADPRADVFYRFDGFSRLASSAVAQFNEVGPDDWRYDDIDERQYEYDALGRRILERQVGANTNERFSIYLFNDVNGKVIEEQRRSFSSSTVQTSEQYVLSDVDANLIVLRDRNADSFSSGDLGMSGSGLEERIWVEQAPDGSVLELQLDGGSGVNKETFVYTPEGAFQILDDEGANVYLSNTSRYDWRYFWRAGRADAYLETSSGVLKYDGLLWTGSSVHDTNRGTPVGEDIYAYYSSAGEHVQWNYQQSMYPGAGTSGAWSKPQTYDIGGQMYDPQMQYYTPPAWEAWAQRGSALVGATALTLASGGIAAPAAWASVAGMWGGAVVGAGVGAGIAYAKGWDVNTGAGYGADVGSVLGAFAPNAVRAASWIGSRFTSSVVRFGEIPTLADESLQITNMTWRGSSRLLGVNFLRTKRVVQEMARSAIGRFVVNAAEKNEIDLVMSVMDRGRNILGASVGNSGAAYVRVTQSYAETASTLIHEGLHALGLGGSRRAEALVRIGVKVLHEGQPLNRGLMRGVLEEMGANYNRLPWRLNASTAKFPSLVF